MSTALAFLSAVLLFVAPLIVFNDWRVTIPLLLAAEMSRIGLMWQTADAINLTLMLIEAVTAVSVSLILLVTAFTFTRPYQSEQLDEFALLELRRAARYAQHQRAQAAGRWTGTIVPIGALLLAGLATWLLSTFYPVAKAQTLDAGWIFLLLCGLLVLITANDALKMGLGLLLLMGSAKLLYFGVATRINVIHIGLLELLTLVLAVTVAYLSGILFARLRTLELNSLFER
jgi:hypothetical protein